MTEDYRATPRQWDDAEYYGNPDRQPCPISAYACILELRARVEALEARHQSGFAEITTSLHSYKIGEAEPIEDWGKGHTLVNPKPPSLREQALATLQRVSKDQYPCNYQDDEDWDTIRRALEQLPDTL